MESFSERHAECSKYDTRINSGDYYHVNLIFLVAFGHGSDAITFIENNSNITKIIRFNNKHVFIRKAYSVLILDSAANTLFDTSDVDTSVPNYNKIEELVPPVRH